MKAVTYDHYGSPDVLKLGDVAKPAPRSDEVLVRVHAASVNSWDWDLLTGDFLTRALGAPFRPSYRILGADIAGHVEAVGNQVTRFKPGDEVYGDLCESGWGGFAEYVSAKQDALAPKPPQMSFQEAAALPQAGALALQGLQRGAPIEPGQQVLINGAGGGVGTLAVQIAKSLGAEVTAVDRGEKLELLRSLGADHVIDYTREDFANEAERYDCILDVTAHRSIFDYRRALRPGGRYVMLGGTPGRILQLLLVMPWLALTRSDKKMTILPVKANGGLDDLAALFEDGKLAPVIDGDYTLEQTPQALRNLGEGRIQGKAVITI